MSWHRKATRRDETISGNHVGTGNNAPLLSDNIRAKPLRILNNARRPGIVAGMRQILLPGLLALLVSVAANAAGAACYADYKAKRDNPLRLHYGVIQLPDAACQDRALAERETRERVARGGWELLNVVGTFDDSGLNQRRDSAGDFFLRF